MKYVGRSRLSGVGVYIGALAVFLFFVAPLLWMVSTAFKSQDEWFSTPPDLVPTHPTLSNFAALASSEFPRFFANSFIVCSITTTATMLFAVYAAYALGTMRFWGKSVVLAGIVLTQMVPVAVIVLPLYQTASQLGLLDSLVGLSVAYLSFTVPVAAWLLIGFFAQLPMELQEAAQLDGCTKLQAFRRVILPLAVPGIVATAMYAFFNAWQELLLALTFLSTKSNSTFTVGILGFIGEHNTDWGQLMAASVLLTIPVFAIFWYLQRFLVAGLAQGALKG